MRRVLAVAALIAAPVGGHETIGAFKGWAAFRDATPARCYAIAEPLRAGGSARWRPFASVAAWPGRGLGESLHIRLSRERDAARPVTLSVGERRFVLAADRVDAWATDGPSDRAIVTAIRSGRSLSVEAVARGGRPFADVYALGGAATAIDAATLACATR